MRQESCNYFDSIIHILLLCFFLFFQGLCGKPAVTKQQLVQKYLILFENMTSQMMGGGGEIKNLPHSNTKAALILTSLTPKKVQHSTGLHYLHT